MERVKSKLNSLKIPYFETEEGIDFNFSEINCFVDINKNIFVDNRYFCLIPHIMENGQICTTGNKSIELQESEIDKFGLVLDEYLPWLISLDPNLKVVEFLGEISYYLGRKYKTEVKMTVERPSSFESLQITNPNNLWESINELKQNVWYRISPIGIEHYVVYLKHTGNKSQFTVFDDQSRKASMRVLGLNFEVFDRSSVFIGVGSVNSYIIKSLIAHEAKKLVVIDDAKVETGNAFRFAFPFKNVAKVEAVRIFASLVDKDIKVIKKKKKIGIESENYIQDNDYIFISVDDPFSWIDTCVYASNYAKSNSRMVLSAIDAFGNYAKYSIISMNQSKVKIYERIRDFLFYSDDHPRKEMIGNGCGRSLAIYNEGTLIDFAEQVVETILRNKFNDKVNIYEIKS